MINLKKQKKQMKYDRATAIAIISSNGINLVQDKYVDWLDNNGWIPFYELMVEIADEVLFTEGSLYMVALAQGRLTDEFHRTFPTMFDWWILDEGMKLIDKYLQEPDRQPKLWTKEVSK